MTCAIEFTAEELQHVLNVKLKDSEPREILDLTITYANDHPETRHGTLQIVYRPMPPNDRRRKRGPTKSAQICFKLMTAHLRRMWILGRSVGWCLPENEFYNHVLCSLVRSSHSHIDTFAITRYMAKGLMLVHDQPEAMGFCSTEHFRWFSQDQLVAVVEALSRLHAASLVSRGPTDKPYWQSHPLAFNDETFTYYTIQNKRLKYVLRLCERIGDMIVGLTEEDVGLIRYAVVKAFVDILYVSRSGRTRLRAVVCHGTTLPGTVLLSMPQKRSRAIRAIFSDFGRMSYGLRMLDFGQCVYTCGSLNLNEAQINELINAYHSEQFFSLLGETPTLDQITDEWKQMKLASIYLAIINTPTIWLGEKRTLDNNREVLVKDLLSNNDLHPEFLALMISIEGLGAKMKMLVKLLCQEAKSTMMPQEIQRYQLLLQIMDEIDNDQLLERVRERVRERL